jgi:hypothetical protein
LPRLSRTHIWVTQSGWYTHIDLLLQGWPTIVSAVLNGPDLIKYEYISSRVLGVSLASLLKLLRCSRFIRWYMCPIVLASIETSLKLFTVLIHCCVQLQHVCLACSLHLLFMMPPVCSMYIPCHIHVGCSVGFRFPCECYLESRWWAFCNKYLWTLVFNK